MLRTKQDEIEEEQAKLEETLRSLKQRQEEKGQLDAEIDELRKYAAALVEDKQNAEVAAQALLSELRPLEPLPAAVSARKLGALSAKFETGGREPGTVSSGVGDAGGVSYGSYQLTSRPDGGLVARLVADPSFPWRARFRDLEPGSVGFTEQWKALAAEAPEAFFEAQHDFIKRRTYDPLVQKIISEDHINIDERSQALRDVIWSTALQHGAGTPVVHRALVRLQSNGISNEDPKFDEELIKAIYAERSKKTESGNLYYFSRNSRAVQEGVKRRLDVELREALANLEPDKSAPE